MHHLYSRLPCTLPLYASCVALTLVVGTCTPTVCLRSVHEDPFAVVEPPSRTDLPTLRGGDPFQLSDASVDPFGSGGFDPSGLDRDVEELSLRAQELSVEHALRASTPTATCMMFVHGDLSLESASRCDAHCGVMCCSVVT